MTTSRCPICASEALSTIYTIAPDYITGSVFQVRKCNNCETAFTTPKPSDLSQFYPEKYRRYNPIILNVLKTFYNLRSAKWANGFKSPGVVFEMGCGDGIMLNSMRRYGWKVFGNERTLGAAHFARHQLNIPIFVGGLESLSPVPIADLIILFQVLEHLEDPIKTLKQLNPLLKPNGKLIIGVPNFGGWQAKIGGAKWLHLDVPRHLFHFSPQSLQYCLNESGFAITQISYKSFEHDPYGWSQSILNLLFKQHNLLTRFLMRLDKPSPAIIIHLVLAAALGILFLPISILSWLFHSGAILEVTAEKVKSEEQKPVSVL